MAGQQTSEIAIAHCPWCSAELREPAASSCPSCGATLAGEAEPSLPGVTAVDNDAIRAARMPAPQRRSRLLSWISGEDSGVEEAPAPPGSLAPPPPDVRREMLRLELEAELTNLQAEAESIVSESEADAREARPVPNVLSAPTQPVPPAEPPATDSGTPPPA
jgi:hypothetical protein